MEVIKQKDMAQLLLPMTITTLLDVNKVLHNMVESLTT